MTIDSTWREQLDEDKQKRLAWAELYASDFRHGATGHNDYLLVAHLALLLDVATGVREMPKLPEGSDLILTFGKYRDKTIGQIWLLDPGYVDWLAHEGRDLEVRAAAQALIAPTPFAPVPIEEEGEDPLL